MDVATVEALRERHRVVRANQNEVLAVRLHRAISWLHRAGQDNGDDDARFILLWIAFNAAYAGEFDGEQSERQRVADFISRLVAVDSQQQLHRLLFQQFSGPVRLLIDNRYVFAPFWRALRDHDSSDRWKQRFDASRKAAMDAALGQRTAELLSIVLDRLYVLRNQLVHGGATWNSSINRAQLRDGCALLSALLPAMISLMMETDAFSDDAIAYPVVPEYSTTRKSTVAVVSTTPCSQGPATATETVAPTD
ncbi:HEPN domain-containing protein [Stenotrophomonas sp. YIM B06876]|uniref:HEPN domain-containing protein n=1 Tax=Stenotrophomonas sp. YIM B06876 TaxID=3060211 RepID=UPI0027397AE8|nr:HEPN domain-containing protein [Stenotrophomonas sp. YIM B06876]